MKKGKDTQGTVSKGGKGTGSRLGKYEIYSNQINAL